MQTECQVAANPQTKPTDLGCESANSVGMWRGTDRHADRNTERHTDGRDHYTSCLGYASCVM